MECSDSHCDHSIQSFSDMRYWGVNATLIARRRLASFSFILGTVIGEVIDFLPLLARGRATAGIYGLTAKLSSEIKVVSRLEASKNNLLSVETFTQPVCFVFVFMVKVSSRNSPARVLHDAFWSFFNRLERMPSSSAASSDSL